VSSSLATEVNSFRSLVTSETDILVDSDAEAKLVSEMLYLLLLNRRLNLPQNQVNDVSQVEEFLGTSTSPLVAVDARPTAL
jgi:hypothetical protein